MQKEVGVAIAGASAREGVIASAQIGFNLFPDAHTQIQGNAMSKLRGAMLGLTGFERASRESLDEIARKIKEGVFERVDAEILVGRT